MPFSARYKTVVVAGFLLAGPVVHADSIYRYSDNGRVTYGDSLPVSADDKGYTVLNRQGITLEQIADREKRKQAQKEAQERERHAIQDRTLLATFTSEEDLLNTRDDRLGMLDSQISRLDERIHLLQNRLDEVNQQGEEQIGPNRSNTASLEAEKSSLNARLESTWTLLEARSDARQKVATKFDNDLQRYRELKARH